ncbi:MAG: TrkH family potassium uptake protein [Culicoidibacterales bacterium]
MKNLSRILWGYALYMIGGAFFLMLPIAHKSGVGLPFIDALFVSASAISTTGLTPVSAAEFSFIGQVGLMMMLFVGGLGYMTFGAFLALTIHGTLSTQQHGILKSAFALPSELNVKQFVFSTGIYALVVQLLGAFALYFVFQDDPRANPIFSSLFHSISIFTTAGFSIYPNGVETYVLNTAFNVITIIVAILGSLGFIVATDVASVVRGQRQRLTFTTKIILTMTFGILFVSTALVYLFGDYTIGDSWWQTIMVIMFENTNAMTTSGFSTINLSQVSIGFLMVLMMILTIGGAPSGTAGGIKVTTVSAIFAAVHSFTRGSKQTYLMGRKIPDTRVQQAFSNFVIYIVSLVSGILLLFFIEPDINPLFLMFEAASALGTTGMSAGITSSLTTLAKFVLIVLMYMGRVGVFTVAAVILVRSRQRQSSAYADADVAV